MEVGLHYLTLDRTAPTLSGGEAQRVRLASQIGCGLVGITYILDEPSIGLHPRDNKKLIQTLKHLRDMGNTVIVVEHDEETIWEADRIVDFGPAPESAAEKSSSMATLQILLTSERSITAAYLTGKLINPDPQKTAQTSKRSSANQGSHSPQPEKCRRQNSLRPLCCCHRSFRIGKISLITDILYPALIQSSAWRRTSCRRS